MSIKNKVFDSCVYPKDYKFNSIKDLANNLKKNKIYRALCMSKPNTNLKLFFDNTLKFDNLVPIASLKGKKDLRLQLEKIKKIGFKFLKIHPRFLNLPITENWKFYDNIFKLNEKYKLKILLCTLNSWEKEPNDLDLVHFIFKISKKFKNQKIILMHGGGSEILKYYEIFRFSENIFLDISYSMMHYQKTSLEENFKFLMKKFDKRLILGSDFPCFNFNNFNKAIQKYSINITDEKKKNFMFQNLESLYSE